MNDRFGSTPADIGQLFTKVGIIVMFFQVVGYWPILRYLGFSGIGIIGAASLSTGLVGLGLPQVPLWLALIAYSFGKAAFSPTITTLLSGTATDSNRGLILGLHSNVNNICRMVAPIFLGFLYAHSPMAC